MHFISDLHLHSKYSRAVSKNMELEQMVKWAHKKGIDLITVADWTHPLWFKEMRSKLTEAQEGMYILNESLNDDDPLKYKELRFILSVEISSIYSQGGQTRRIHNLVFASSFEVAEKINAQLLKRGANLSADGRPIIGLSAKDLLTLILEIDEKSFLIPCHIWTPWFSVFGSKSGFNSLKECFGELADKIFAVETGLSSDPFMNWQIEELDNRSIVSFSDSHSLIKLGREATVFDFNKDLNEVSFLDIKKALMRQNGGGKIAYTIEFYPEEGKYHYTGHRNCQVVYGPKDSLENGTICPVCKRPLTVGVVERVNELASRQEFKMTEKENNRSLKWIIDPKGNHPPFVSLVPLIEIVAESLNVLVGSQRVMELYDKLCYNFGSEFNVLLKENIDDIEKFAGERVAEAIQKVRKRDISISPGYDGVFGKVKIWDQDKVEGDDNSMSQTAFDF